MPKYTITIADIEINVNTEEKPEMVDTLVGIIDRRIREIIMKSPRCSKSEAAILCALDYCAERIKSENTTRELENENKKLSADLEALTSEYNAAQKELDDLRRDNRTMSDLIAKAAANVAGEANDASDEKPAEEVKLPEVQPGEQLSINTMSTDDAKAEEVPSASDVMFNSENADELVVKKKTTRRSNRSKNAPSKFGDMFGTLTFKDI